MKTRRPSDSRARKPIEVPLIRVTRDDFSDEIKVLLDPFNLRKCLLGICQAQFGCSINVFLMIVCTVGCMRVKSSAKNVIMGTTLLPLAWSCATIGCPVSLPAPSLSSRCHWPHFTWGDWGLQKQVHLPKNKESNAPDLHLAPKWVSASYCSQGQSKAAGLHLRKRGLCWMSEALF